MRREDPCVKHYIATPLSRSRVLGELGDHQGIHIGTLVYARKHQIQVDRINSLYLLRHWGSLTWAE